jgi:hypothetical protein
MENKNKSHLSLKGLIEQINQQRVSKQEKNPSLDKEFFSYLRNSKQG